MDDARFDTRGACFEVDLEHAVQVLRDIDHDAGADGVSSDGRAGPPHRQRDAGGGRRGDGGDELIGVTRPDHDSGNYSVERSVRTVEGAGEDRVVHVADAVAPQCANHIAGHIGCGRHPALLGMEE